MPGAGFSFWPKATASYFIIAALLLPLNISLEVRKWQILAGTAMTCSFLQSLRSVLGGIAASLVTPNRIGEYPGRIMMMDGAVSTRLISVSVLGACAQMLSLMLAGLAGLGYYTAMHPRPHYFLVFAITAVFTAFIVLLYFSFERWAPRIEHIPWLRRLRLWARLLHRFTRREQWVILAISLLRLTVFTTQYWLLLRWQGIPLPVVPGLLLCALFFWVMAVIPTIAIAELGVRGTVGIFLFGTFAHNAAGITVATFTLWCLNLVLPAISGIWFYFRKSLR